MWLKILTSDSLLLARHWTFGFYKMRRIFWQAEKLLASQKGLFSVYQTADTDIHAAMYQVSYLYVFPSLIICFICGVYVHTNRSNAMFVLWQCTLFHTRSPFIALPATFRNNKPPPRAPNPKYLAQWHRRSTYISLCIAILVDISKQG
jgi:hypothetical protein